jgi:4-amino-4-deoxy-L-arabinose transferase-like glycosyltransferase
MKVALVIIAVAAGVRLILAALVPLVPDETYYWEWSRHLAAGYFDHPPAVAWLVRAGTAVAGETALGVRLGIIAVGFIGCLAAVALAHRVAGRQGATRAAWLMSATPLAGIGLVLATPDVPLLAGTAVVLWAFDHALEEESIPRGASVGVGAQPVARTGWWVVVGIALGTTLLSKYPAVLVPAGVALGCAVSPVLRREFRRPGPYLACVIAIVLFLPVVRWNADHGWVSFAFQMRHGLTPPRAGGPLQVNLLAADVRALASVVGRELNLLGVQLGLVTPILFVLVVAAVVSSLRQPRAGRVFLLASVATFISAFFAASAIRHPVSPNWPALALLPGVLVLAVQRPGPTQARWEIAGIALAATVVLALSVHAVHRWLPLRPRQDPVAQAHGWDELARAVAADDDRVDPAGERVWLAADRYQEASELAWELPGHPVVFSLELASRRNEYDLWPTAADSVRIGDAMTVVLDETTDVPTPVRRLTPLFQHVVRGALVDMHWGAGRVVAQRRIWHFLGLTVPLSTTLGRPSS